jgi:O-antigen ligase/Tfp pilus assembly protein PilF
MEKPALIAHRLPIPYISFFMLLFAVSAVLGVLLSYDRSLTNSALVAVLGSVALYFVIAYLVRSWLAVRLVSGVVLLIAALLALVFISQYGHQGYGETPPFIEQLGNLTTLPIQLGIFLHPNATASFLGVAVPLGAMRAISSRVFARKIFWALCTLIILYAIFLTFSRGVYLALAAVAALAVAIYIIRRLPRRIALPIVGLGILALMAGLVVIVALGPDKFPLLSSTFSRATDRGLLYQNSLSLVGDYPFTGIGIGDTFAMVYSRYVLLIFVPFVTYAHNLPLAIWLNQGLLGLLAFAGIVVTLYLFVYRVMHTVESVRRLFHGAWLGATVALLHGITDAPQYADHRWVMPMLFVAIGLTVAAGRVAVQELDEYEQPPPVDWRRRLAFAAVLILFLVGGLVALYPTLIAAWYTNLGAVDEARAELAPGPGAIDDQIGDEGAMVLTEEERVAYYDSAEAYYRQALTANPLYPPANRRLGNLLVNRAQYEAAVPLLENAFAAEPTYPAVIKGLGLAYVWVGRLDDAIHMFAQHNNPAGIASELNTWGYFRTEQGRPLLAARAWETAQLMYPDSVNIPVWLLIADTYRSAEETDDARRWYERILENDPNNQPAQEALARMG